MNIDPVSKPAVKRQMFEGVLSLKAQLFKNWGNIEIIKTDDNELDFKFRV